MRTRIAAISTRLFAGSNVEQFAKWITLGVGLESLECSYEGDSILRDNLLEISTQCHLCCTAQRAEGTISSPVSPAQRQSSPAAMESSGIAVRCSDLLDRSFQDQQRCWHCCPIIPYPRRRAPIACQALPTALGDPIRQTRRRG